MNAHVQQTENSVEMKNFHHPQEDDAWKGSDHLGEKSGTKQLEILEVSEHIVMLQRQVPTVQTVHKNRGGSSSAVHRQRVDISVNGQSQVPTVLKPVKVPQVRHDDNFFDVSNAMYLQVPTSSNRAESR